MSHVGKVAAERTLADTIGWEKTQHACRFCGGRVLSRLGLQFECSTCDVRCEGSPMGICGCGMHLGWEPMDKRAIDRRKATHPPAWRCIANQAISQTNPAKFVIAFGERQVNGPRRQGAV